MLAKVSWKQGFLLINSITEQVRQAATLNEAQWAIGLCLCLCILNTEVWNPMPRPFLYLCINFPWKALQILQCVPRWHSSLARSASGKRHNPVAWLPHVSIFKSFVFRLQTQTQTFHSQFRVSKIDVLFGHSSGKKNTFLWRGRLSKHQT